MVNDTAVKVLGLIGTALWCIQLIPQIVRNYYVKDCTGFPPIMIFLWAFSGIPFSIYFFGIDGLVPLRIQPQLFTVFCIILWAQALYYPPVLMARRKLVLLVGLFVLFTVAAEVGLILWLRPLYRRGIHWPMNVVGIVASVLLALGLVPIYFEMAKRRGRVVGINFLFLGLDCAGGFFSLASVIVGSKDALSLTLYAIVVGMELGIFATAFVWWATVGRGILEQERLAKEAEEAGPQEEKSLEDSLELHRSLD